jgi:molybdopterin-guanine dinucleotide biosynthesis protein A
VNNKRDDITAFILAGGKSSRMGVNKAFLEIDGKMIIQRLLELLDKLFKNIIICSNDIASFEFTGRKIVKDIFPNKGPLAGLHSGLTISETDKNFFISCDLPFISGMIIRYLCDYKSDASIILPIAEKRIQQMCGLYSINVLRQAEKLLIESKDNTISKTKGSIFELIESVPTEIADVSKLEYYYKDIFFNMNTPDDYEYVKNKIANK